MLSPLMEKLIELKMEWAKLKEAEKEWSTEPVISEHRSNPNAISHETMKLHSLETALHATEI